MELAVIEMGAMKYEKNDFAGLWLGWLQERWFFFFFFSETENTGRADLLEKMTDQFWTC